jgi:hypothetical protein
VWRDLEAPVLCADLLEPVEPFRSPRLLEAPGGCTDGDLGDPLSADTPAISTGALAGTRGKDVADDGSTSPPGRVDERGTSATVALRLSTTTDWPAASAPSMAASWRSCGSRR